MINFVANNIMETFIIYLELINIDKNVFNMHTLPVNALEYKFQLKFQ